ncbi:MAG: hypothetical protein JRN68_06975 [Nitrososphaerota archaeon]|nr:hypothetical protein [Nitrososphaerota archaeon]
MLTMSMLFDTIGNGARLGMREMIESRKMNPLLIVDASNVAFGTSYAKSRPMLSTLRGVLAMLPTANLDIKVIADASLRHKIDNREDYERIIRSGEVIQAPAGRSADQFIAHLARKRMANHQRVYILTNDLLRQWPDLESLRVTFLDVGGGEMIFDPPLEILPLNSIDRTLETPVSEHTGLNVQTIGSPNETIVPQPIYYRDGKSK